MTNRWRLSFNEIARSNYCSGYRLVISLIKMNILDRHVGFDEHLHYLSGQETFDRGKYCSYEFLRVCSFSSIFYNFRV